VFPGFVHFLQGFFSFFGVFDLGACDSHDFYAGEVGLKVEVEGEAVGFDDFPALGVLDQDFEFCAGQ
jgi:hypothetical protein